MRRGIVLSLCLSLLLPTSVTYGQSTPEPPPPAVFPQLFPHPTGLNGYEDVIAAGDLIRQNATLDAAVQPDATLTQKRTASTDPSCRRALVLLRQGLSKPMQSPRTRIDFATSLPDLTQLRSLARLLRVEQYIFLAEGRTTAAIQCLGDSMRLADVIRSETIITGLTGIAIDAISLYLLCQHKEQWTEADCGRILQISKRYLDRSDQGAAALEGERRVLIAGLERLIADIEKPENASFFDEVEEGNEAASLKQEFIALKNNPTAREAFATELKRRINRACDEAIAANPWQSKPPVISVADRTLLGTMTNLLVPNFQYSRRNFSKRQVEFQLLGIQAGIQRYRWQHNKLPASLDEIGLKEMIIDPYSNQPFSYKMMSPDTYTLSSIGPIQRTEEGQSVNENLRDPITLPPIPAVAR